MSGLFDYIMEPQSKDKVEVSSFLVKLLRILEDAECQTHIQWTQTEDGFQIPNVVEFTENVLPKYFKHKNFCSFVRQLNIYGFNKVKNSQNVYQNPNFKRGSKPNLRKNERKVQVEEKTSIVARTRAETHHHHEKAQASKIQQLKQKHESLESRMKQALGSARQALAGNKKIIEKMSQKNSHEQQLVDNLLKIFSVASKPMMKTSSLGNGQKKHNLSMKKQTPNTAPARPDTDYLNFNQFQQFSDFQDLEGLQNIGHQP